MHRATRCEAGSGLSPSPLSATWIFSRTVSQGEVLKDDGNAGMNSVQRLAVRKHLSAGGLNQSDHGAQQRAFTAAAWTENRHHFSSADGQGNVLDRQRILRSAVGNGNIANLTNWCAIFSHEVRSCGLGVKAVAIFGQSIQPLPKDAVDDDYEYGHEHDAGGQQREIGVGRGLADD